MPLTSVIEIVLRGQRCSQRVVRITSAVRIASNRWRYTAVEVIPRKDGLYRDSLAADRWQGFAYNTFESNNTEEGPVGSGDEVDYLPARVTLQPIGLNAVVQGVIRFEPETGEPEIHFSVPNNISGRCIQA